MLNFDFLEKGLELASPLHFVFGFLRKIIEVNKNGFFRV